MLNSRASQAKVLPTFLLPFLMFTLPLTVHAELSDEAAELFCRCNGPAYALQEEAMEAFTNGDSVRVVEINDELAELRPVTDQCNRAMRDKYDTQGDAFAAAVNQRINRLCPHPHWGGSMPTMGGVGDGISGGDPLSEFMRAQGAPQRR